MKTAKTSRKVTSPVATSTSANSAPAPADFVLSGERAERFTALAIQRGVSAESLVQAAVNRYLDQLEFESAPDDRLPKLVNDAMQLEAEAIWVGCGITGIGSIMSNLRTDEDNSEELDTINFIATELRSKIRNLSQKAAEHRIELSAAIRANGGAM